MAVDVKFIETWCPHALDDLAKIVLKKRGVVIVVPTECAATSTGVAAIYRC